MELEREELLYLLVFGILEVKYDLERTGMKIWIKTAKITCTGMCSRIHFLDLQQLDRWLNRCKEMDLLISTGQKNLILMLMHSRKTQLI